MSKNPLKTINRAAKALKAKHPNMSHAEAQKKAGKAYREGTIGSITKAKKKAAPKKRAKVGSAGKPKYRVTHVVHKISGVSYKGGQVKIAGSPEIEATKNKLRSKLAQQSGWLDLALAQEKGGRKKSQLRKEKARVLREMRQLK